MTSGAAHGSRRVALGVNVDHVATLRQARGVSYPDPVAAARIALAAGADGITAHLREDRRHIQDADVECLRAERGLKLNLEMAATAEMVEIACRVRPDDVCIVPERRAEVTTEGGLAVAAHERQLAPAVARLRDAGIRVSLFIDAEPEQIAASARVGATVVELHTGRYADASGAAVEREVAALRRGAQQATGLGLTVNAGHGLTVENVGPIARLPGMHELNIGHSIVARAVLIGMAEAVREMLAAIAAAIGASAARAG
ncbi:MAG TPA: pyridoxine 5'-phosphate synthase [Candidatus Binatia bacterium]|nr:pyridoxine 5'-phosphate synthase [Candidatus Binatia bacterium]